MAATYHLPKYRLSRWWSRNNSGQLDERPESAMTAADFMSMTVTAVPTGDGAFGSWRGGPTVVSGSLPETVQTQMLADGAGESGAHKTLLLGADYAVTAVFNHRPGMETMDLAGDVAALLDAAGETTQSNFFNLSYDSGELTFDDDGAWLYTANGIPDAAEMAFLQAILKDAGYEQAAKGGVSHEYVWRAYAGNLELARTQLPTQGESAQRAVAALLTMGDLGHAFHARKLVQTAFGVELNLDDQYTDAGRWLGAKNDANADGVSNKDAWTAASQEAGAAGAATGAAGDAVGNFIGYGAGDETFAGGGGGGGGGGGEKSASSDCGCWNDSCVTAVTLKVQSASSTGTGAIHAEGFIASPEQCPNSPVDINAAAGGPVQPGRKVKVTASGAGFTTWDAPGTPIDRCDIPGVTFVHGGGQTVAPALSQGSLEIDYDSTHVNVGASSAGKAPLVKDSTSIPGHDIYQGVSFNPVSLTATGSYVAIFKVLVDEGKPTEHEEDRPITVYLVGWKILTTVDDQCVYNLYEKEPTVLLGLVGWASPLYESDSTPVDTTNMHEAEVAHTPVAPKGGYLMANGHLGGIARKWWVPDGSGAPLDNVWYSAWAFPGFTCSAFEMQGVEEGRGGACRMVDESTTGCADFEPMATITVEIASEGSDPTGAKPECMGYYTLSPAKYYYTPDLPAVGTLPASLGQEVTITATPRAGYKFVKWVGTGKYKLGDAEVPLGDDDLTVTTNPITVVMHSSRTLKAVFELRKALVITGEGWTVPSTAASGALEACRYKVSDRPLPKVSDVLEVLAKHEVFVYIGHGGTDWMTFQYPCMFCNPDQVERLFLGDITASGMSPTYKLAVMECCAAGDNANNWKSAFNAEAYVGCSSSMPAYILKQFDPVFWELIGQGVTSAEAARQTVTETGINASWVITRGDRGLKGCN